MCQHQFRIVMKIRKHSKERPLNESMSTKTAKKNRPNLGFLLNWAGKSLADQGSNLDSSGPKPDVLPVTPSAKLIPSRKGVTNVAGLFF